MVNESADFIAIVRAAELMLQSPAIRQEPAALEGLLADEFMIFGTSGLVWSREEFLASVARFESSGAPFEITDISALAVTDDVVLVTYLSTLPSGRRARRSSLWRSGPGGPQIVFHQGTDIS